MIYCIYRNLPPIYVLCSGHVVTIDRWLNVGVRRSSYNITYWQTIILIVNCYISFFKSSQKIPFLFLFFFVITFAKNIVLKFLNFLVLTIFFSSLFFFFLSPSGHISSLHYIIGGWRSHRPSSMASYVSYSETKTHYEKIETFTSVRSIPLNKRRKFAFLTVSFLSIRFKYSIPLTQLSHILF